MKRWATYALVGLVAWSVGGGRADARGFGGARGGGGGGGGSRPDSFGSAGLDSHGGERSSRFEGTRSDSSGGWSHSGEVSGSRSSGYDASGGRAAAGTSYDRSYSGSRGGTYSASGERGVAAGPNGAAAGGSRDVSATGPGGRSYDSSTSRGAVAGPNGGVVAGGSRGTTATGPDGRSYSGSSERGAAVGPYGRTVGGSSGSATATGPRRTASADWQSAFAGAGHMATDGGLSHYTAVGAAGAYHSTSYWSHGYVTGQANAIRGSFGYYGSFNPAWYTAHPGCWAATGWAAGAAWSAATWPAVTSFCSIPAAPINYDFGNTVVIQGDTVYQNGQPAGTASAFAAQATTIADKGLQAEAPPDQEWKPLGVYALTQGDEQQPNYVLQLAVNRDGVIRGNYYDGLTDSNTPVYGSVDPKTRRAAWTIGKKSDRVFDAGISNLTGDQCPVLVHVGKDRTQQWLLARVQQAKGGQ